MRQLAASEPKQSCTDPGPDRRGLLHRAQQAILTFVTDLLGSATGTNRTFANRTGNDRGNLGRYLENTARDAGAA
ncbi:MAG: hypothetical protein ABFC42_07810, partial [Sulfuricella sp.]